jgi:polysaccharide biosynthesis transport protein
LRRDRAVLLSKLTEVNPKVQTLDAQIVELERTLKTEKANLFQRIQNEYQAALRREKLELDAYNKQTQTVAGQSEKAYEYTSLKRDAETGRLAYNALLQQYNQMSIAAAVPSSFIRVIEPAIPINIPVEPKPLRDVALPALGGMALGIVLLILKELISVKNRARVFAAPGASGQVLNVPELGILPAFELVDSPQQHARFGLRARPVAEIVSGPVAWSKEPFLTESIRHAFASIRARNIDGAHRLYVVASASPSEGKTTVVGNLALAIAETGQRVLMVDADLRRPRLADVFRLDSTQGLSDIYAAETPIADIELDGFIKPTDTPGLFLMSSGEADSKTVVELPFSARIRELFARLRKEFDYVLIDTPPSVQFSDARILGQISDGVILVIRSGVSSRGTVSLTVRRFEDDGVAIVGTILNHWQPGRNGYVYDDYFTQQSRTPYSGVPKG